MQLQDFGDFKGPRGWPWLLLAVLAVAVLVAIRVFHRPESGGPGQEGQQTEGVSTGESRPVSSDANVAPEGVVPVVFETNTIERLGKASQLEDADNLVEARDYYLAMLSTPLRMADRSEVERRLGQVSTKLLLTPRQMPEKKDHVVQRGESLDKIARKYGTTVELVQISNRLSNAGRIRAGDVLRVFAGKFRLEVSKSRNDLIVYLGDRFFKRYSVGTGKFGKTPEGTFEITERIKEPAWWRPDGKGVPYGDKENILGTRWMTLRATGTTPDVRGYGIHGTWQPESIGKAESAGCIRMKNEDVEEMFTLMPVGTPVTILP